MTVVHGATATTVRPYSRTDEEAVLQLLGASLGGGPAGTRPAEFFRWKHLENPFGESFMLVAEVDRRKIGFRAFIRWQFTTGHRVVTAARAVDTATHPDYQGRGIFSTLTLTALDAMRRDTDLIFNTPNEKSLPGYLKMGWRNVGGVPIRIRIRRPIRFVGRSRSLRRRSSSTAATRAVRVDAAPVATALGDAERVSRLLGRVDVSPGRLVTLRSPEYLRWRYGSAPLLDYRAVTDGSGLAIFRVRPRGELVEATLSELIVARGDLHGVRRLVRAVAHAAAVDHIAMSLAPGSDSERAVRRATFRAPGGMTLVVNPLASDLGPDPTRLASWALALGDLEVF